MALLPLAVDIAEMVLRARERRRGLDVATEAERLLHDHPDANLTEREVAEVLHGEALDAGLPSAGTGATA